MAERNRIRQARENAQIAEIERQGMQRAVVMSTAPAGMTYEQVMTEREIERRTIAAIAAGASSTSTSSSTSSSSSTEQSSGSSSGGGAITVSDTRVEDERREADEKARWDAVAERDRQQAAADKAATEEHYRKQDAAKAKALDCYGQGVSGAGSSSSGSGSTSGATTVCPQ